MKFNLERLRVFYAVVQCKSFTKAAQMLHTTQSNVTNHMRFLEEEVKAKLCYRGHKEFALTSIGREIFEISQQFFHRLENVTKRIKGEGPESGKLRICCPGPFFRFFLSRILKDFSQHYPQVRYSLAFENFNEKSTACDNFDLIFSSTPVQDLERFDMHHFAHYQCFPYATQEYINQWGNPCQFKDLDHHRIIAIDPTFIPFVIERKVNWLLYAGLPPFQKREPFLTIGHDNGSIEDLDYGVILIPHYIAKSSPKKTVRILLESYNPEDGSSYDKFLLVPKLLGQRDIIKKFIDFFLTEAQKTFPEGT